MASANRKGRVKKQLENHHPSIEKFLITNKPTSGSIVSSILNSIIDNTISQTETILEKQILSKPRHVGSNVSEKKIEEWKAMFPWLVINGTGDDMRFTCSICTERKVVSVWARDGSGNIQKDTIQKHNDCSLHKESERNLANHKSKSCSSEDVNFETESPITHTDESILFRTIFYAASEELPSSKINSLLDLQRLNGLSIPYKNLSWDTVIEIQTCIKTILQRDLVSDIKESGVFAIMIDESTDIAVQKHLVVCVRYEKQGCSITKFLGNVSVKDGKASTIVDAVITSLKNQGLDPGNIVSIATDGAAVMVGRKLGFGVQMKARHSPFMTQTHCIAHKLNLAVSDSIKKDKCLEKFREKFGSLYNFMSNSSLRVEKLKELQSIFQEPNLSIKEPYSIRWLGLKNAVQAVYECYSSVLATLSSFATDSATAKGLHKYFSDYKTVLLVAFMLDIHESIGILCKDLQKQEFCFSQIQPSIDGTIGQLNYLETHDGIYLCAMKRCITVKDGENGQEAFLDDEKLLYYSDCKDKEFDNVRKVYITRLVKNLKQRFRKSDMDIFKDLSCVLEPATVSECTDSQSVEALDSLGTLYGLDQEVTILHGSMHEGYEEEKKVVKKLLHKEKLLNEWPKVRGMLYGSYKNKSLQQVCKRIIMMHTDLVEMGKLCKIALCFAVTSVECERSFSTQNRLKNKYRSSMKSENLDTLITISMSNVDFSSYNPSRAVHLWLAKKNRRKARLFQEYTPRVKCAKRVSE